MRKSLVQHLPGVILALLIALAGSWAAAQPWALHWGLSALTLAIVIGLILGNTIYPRLGHTAGPGVNWSKQRLLRLGIILFGLRLSFQDIAAVGWTGVLADATVILSTFSLAVWAGRRWFGLDAQSAMLIGAGSSICGAAAVLAAEPVVKGSADKVAVAVATVVVFGTAAMFLYPAIYALLNAQGLGLDAWNFGIYTGSTVHEVAQVAAAGSAIGDAAAKGAVITKMLRVLMLAPFLIGLSFMLARRESRNAKKAPIVIPWFAVGFVVMAGLRSADMAWHVMPPALLQGLVALGNMLLAMAMAALGLTTHVSAIRRAGPKPLLLAALLFAWLLAGGAAINTVAQAILA
jgi:uncharacterized integral membrane protein (TIGR00698 family)